MCVGGVYRLRCWSSCGWSGTEVSVCLSVCLPACLPVCVCISVCVHLCVSVRACVRACVCSVYARAPLYVFFCASMCASASMPLHVSDASTGCGANWCARVCVCMRVCVCVCVCVGRIESLEAIRTKLYKDFRGACE